MLPGDKIPQTLRELMYWHISREEDWRDMKDAKMRKLHETAARLIRDALKGDIAND